jgi:hypothetical protein
MNVTVIRHKAAVRIAVAVFWRVCLGTLRVHFKPKPRWNELKDLNLGLVGYTEVRAPQERRLVKRKAGDQEYWQKQRLVQFLCRNAVVMEVLLVGTETILKPGDSWGLWEWYWAPGSARYRPVTTTSFRTREEADSFIATIKPEGRWLQASYYGSTNAVRYLGDWVYIPERRLTALWPVYKPGWGVEVPSPIWEIMAV